MSQAIFSETVLIFPKTVKLVKITDRTSTDPPPPPINESCVVFEPNPVSSLKIYCTQDMQMLINRVDANNKYSIVDIATTDFNPSYREDRTPAVLYATETKYKLFYLKANMYHKFNFTEQFDIHNLCFLGISQTEGDIYIEAF